MEITSLKLLSAWDRDTGAALLVNGQVVATVNYDEHGSAGEEILKSVLDGLAKMTKALPEFDEVSDEDFLDLIRQNGS